MSKNPRATSARLRPDGTLSTSRRLPPVRSKSQARPRTAGARGGRGRIRLQGRADQGRPGCLHRVPGPDAFRLLCLFLPALLAFHVRLASRGFHDRLRGVHAPSSRYHGESPLPDDHDPKPPDVLRCPSCASLAVRPVDLGPMLGRQQCDVLIVCMACDAVHPVQGPHAWSIHGHA
jgi:hypothetical protein